MIRLINSIATQAQQWTRPQRKTATEEYVKKRSKERHVDGGWQSMKEVDSGSVSRHKSSRNFRQHITTYKKAC